MKLMPRVVVHARACGACGTPIVPEWQPSPFWPVLHPVLGKFAELVIGIQELPLSESLILPGLSGSMLFHGKMPNTRVLAQHCDFTR